MHKIVGLHNLTRKNGGNVGKKQHSKPFATKTTVFNGLTAKSKLIEYLESKNQIVWQFDSVDDDDGPKFLVIVARTVCVGYPYLAFFGIRPHYESTGEAVTQVALDAITGRDVDWGYDLQRKFEIEYQSLNATSQSDGNDKNDNKNNKKDDHMSNGNLKEKRSRKSGTWSNISMDRVNMNEQNNKNNNISTSKRKRKGHLDCDIMGYILTFVGITPSAWRGLSEHFFYRTLLGLIIDGGSNFMGKNIGVAGRVSFPNL